ncbi:hypothetical protein ACV33G_29730, partial [Pseudomonas aeruginosa]
QALAFHHETVLAVEREIGMGGHAQPGEYRCKNHPKPTSDLEEALSIHIPECARMKPVSCFGKWLVGRIEYIFRYTSAAL